MESPCINVCVIDQASRLCKGCLRSIDEITNWARLGDAGRAKIMAALPARKPMLEMQRNARPSK